MELKLGRSKISSRYQLVLPEGVRKILKITTPRKDKECYAYFFKKNEEIIIRVAVVEKKEEVSFLK